MLAGRGQPGVGQGLAGDGLGVLDVGLGAPAPLAPLVSAAGRDLPHVIAGRGQGQHDRAPQAARALEADPVEHQPVSRSSASSSSMPARVTVNDSRATTTPTRFTTATVAECLCGSMPATA